MLGVLVPGLVIGIGATMIFDLWNLLLNRLLGIPLPNWALVGRWFCHLFSGRFVHRDITSASPVAQELAWGWAFHYAVGASFGLATALIGGAAWLRAPSLGLPLTVGLGTVLFGWLILAPGLGAGIAARLKPNPARIRMLNIMAHFVFGLAMYGIARLIG
jgi:phage shock protein PspC (stress-responsive transcriptional regulator)